MGKKKKRYRLTAHVERARGTQVYEIEASSPEEARRIYDGPDCPECVEEELEVESIGDIEVEEITE